MGAMTSRDVQSVLLKGARAMESYYYKNNRLSIVPGTKDDWPGRKVLIETENSEGKLHDALAIPIDESLDHIPAKVILAAWQAHLQAWCGPNFADYYERMLSADKKRKESLVQEPA
jgi:hypothetical protein